MSETKASLAEWFINSYIRKCAKLCPGRVSCFFDHVSNRTELQLAVSLIVNCRLNQSPYLAAGMHSGAQHRITYYVSKKSLERCPRDCDY